MSHVDRFQSLVDVEKQEQNPVTVRTTKENCCCAVALLVSLLSFAGVVLYFNLY